MSHIESNLITPTTLETLEQLIGDTAFEILPACPELKLEGSAACKEAITQNNAGGTVRVAKSSDISRYFAERFAQVAQ